MEKLKTYYIPPVGEQLRELVSATSDRLRQCHDLVSAGLTGLR